MMIVFMVRQIELWNEAINSQEALASQRDLLAIDGQPPLAHQALERLGKSLADFHVELVTEIAGFDLAEFQLQDKLADQPFVVIEPVGSKERKPI